MRIRTITAATFVKYEDMDEEIEEIGSFLNDAREGLEEEGIEVQTVRLSTQSFGTYQITGSKDGLLEQIVEMEKIVRRSEIDYMSIGPAMSPNYVSMIPDILDSTTVTCASAMVDDRRYGVNWDIVEEAAKAVKRISNLKGDGSKNFNFASISNVEPDTPFFPAAYHIDGPTSFSMGLENGDVVNKALEAADDISDAARKLLDDYWSECRDLQERAISLSTEGMEYSGLDVSFCPSIECDGSLALAIGNLLGKPFGSGGTLSICRMLTSVLDEIHVKRCGYCGLMLPVMEDCGLAESADRGDLSTQRLLSYSSVCGTGLDMIPHPGKVSAEDIKWIIGDVASLSVRLEKPLSARLLPVPGAGSKDSTSIDSPHLVNCKVIPII